MFIAIGEGEHGHVEQCGAAYVATVFFTVAFLPLLPLRSVLAYVDTDGNARSVEIPLNVKSIAAGYARIWGVVVAVGGAFSALRIGSPWAVAVAVIAAVVAAYAWKLLGRLDHDGELRRHVYAKHAGAPIDIAHFGYKAHRGYVESLRASVIDGARGLMAAGYRRALGPETEWATIAVDPTVTVEPFLEDALCLARYETALGDAEMGKLHDVIWQKLRPMVEARAERVRAEMAARG